jgi:AcrR family transcriptional regulator
MRSAILSAALALIVEKGVHDLSLREIARRLDHSPAGLYEYFDSKADILRETRLGALNHFLEALRSVPQDQPFDEFIVQLGQAYIGFAKRHPQEFLLLFTEARGVIDDTPEEAEIASKSYAILHDAVAQAIEAGQIQAHPTLQAAEAAFSFWALVHGMAMMQVSYQRRMDLDFDAVADTAIRALARGLAPS